MSRVEPTIPLQSQQPHSLMQSMGQMLSMKAAVQQLAAQKDALARQAQVADVYKTGGTDDEIAAGLQSTGDSDEILKFRTAVRQMGLFDIQKTKENLTLIKDLSETIENVEKAEPKLQQKFWDQARTYKISLGVPEEQLPQSVEEAKTRFHDAATHTELFNKELDSQAKKLENLKRTQDASRAVLSSARDREKHAAELAGTLPTEKSRNFRQLFLPEFMVDRGGMPALNPQLEAEAMTAFNAREGKSGSIEAQKVAAFDANPELVAKYGSGFNGYELWQNDLIKQRGGGINGLILRGELDPAEYDALLSRQSVARTGWNSGQMEGAVEAAVSGNLGAITSVPSALRGEFYRQLAGRVIVNAKDKDVLKKMDMADHMIERMELYANMIQDDPTNVVAIDTYNGLRQASSSLFSKGVFGEAGNLSEGDVSRALSLTPGPAGNMILPESARLKFKELRGITQKARDIIHGNKGNSTGTNPSSGTERKVTMPNGDIHIYDASGKYVRTEAKQ